jgi:protein gp37
VERLRERVRAMRMDTVAGGAAASGGRAWRAGMTRAEPRRWEVEPRAGKPRGHVAIAHDASHDVKEP